MNLRILALLACLILGLAACGGDGETEGDTESPDGAPITGLIVEIDSEGFDDVRGFTVRSEGETYEFVTGPAEDYSFPLSHLQSHLTNSEPVKVEYEERDGELLATAIDDA